MIRIDLLSCAIVAALPLFAQPTAADNSMEGHVVSLSTGAPISGAVVTLGVDMGRTLSTRPSFPEVETDEQGRFAFRNLGPGIYNLVARRQGFLRAQYRSIGSHSVVLGEGQSLAGVVLKLIPEAVLDVKAIDSDGRPLKRGLLRLIRAGPSAVGRESVVAATERTNDAGECRMANLAPGDYVLESNPLERRSQASGRPMQAGAELAEVPTYYPDAAEPQGGAVVHIEPGETRSVEVRLKKAPTVSIRGRIVDPELNIGTTSVRLVTRDAPDRSLYAWSPEIGADGSFVIAAVTSGEYLLAAARSRIEEQPTGPGSGTVTVHSIAHSVTPLAAAARSVKVSGRSLNRVTLDMAPMVDLSGSVTVEQNAQCRFTSGIDSVTHVLLSPEVPVATHHDPVRIDGGAFTLRNIARIPYRVTVSYHGDCYVKAIRYGGKQANDGVVDFAGNGPLEIVFAMGERLEGMVVDHDGRPLSRATVTLVPKNGPVSSIQSADSGANGAFTLRGIRKGAYNLFAWDETFDSTPRQELLLRLLKAFKGRGTSVTLDSSAVSPRPRIEVVSAADIARFSGPLAAPPPVKSRGAIAGQVLDGASGSPIKGATLRLQGWREATPEAVATTDDGGRFEFRSLEPGFYKLSAQHSGFAAAAHGNGESPFGSIILGEGQHVAGIEMRLSPRP